MSLFKQLIITTTLITSFVVSCFDEELLQLNCSVKGYS